MDRLKIKRIALLLLLVVQSSLFAQRAKILDNVSNEKVTLTTNTNLFVAGETLYYKLYNFNVETNVISSTLSKMAYVLLIDDTKKVIFKHKLKLKLGKANGDYYLPENLKTGNYKLIAYTKWMNNNVEKPYFYKNIYVINPFEKQVSSNKKTLDSICVNSKETYTYITKVKTRSEVSIDTDLIKVPKGDYVVSVRKLDEVMVSKNKELSTNQTKKQKFSIPEFRGELLSGTVYSKDKTPLKNKNVFLSITNNHIFKNTTTNEDGKFYFILSEDYNRGDLILQLAANKTTNKIILDKEPFPYLNELEFHKLYLDSKIENWLLQRSINNQIESSYHNLNNNVEVTKQEIPFYGKPSFEYVLDDYTRFPTMKETFIEIIAGASIIKKKGKEKVIIASPNAKLNRVFLDLDTLILIDGILVRDEQFFINFNPNLIEKINFVKEVYFYGSKIYNGIIDVTTIKGDFTLPYLYTNSSKYITNPVRKKEIYTPDYKTNDLSRIPDNRIQLLWIGDYTNQQIKFQTSDLKGVFEIVIEGFTDKSKPIKIEKHLLVE